MASEKVTMRVADPRYTSLGEEIAGSLLAGTYECAICVDHVTSTDPVWACDTCYGIVHIECLRSWIHHGADNGAWRCPKCQKSYATRPQDLTYTCFCKKTVRPATLSFSTPHTCEAVCGRVRRGTPCPHPCASVCHPGPCPPCPVVTPPKPCFCGKTTYVSACDSVEKGHSCGQVCGATLSCGNHTCEQDCHNGPCAPCPVTYPQSCFCGSVRDEDRPCKKGVEVADEAAAGDDAGSPQTFSCMGQCPKTLLCGKHPCTLPCHAGDCPVCHLLPSEVVACACGKTKVEALKTQPGAQVPERVSCTDPLPTCGAVCGKPQDCGKPGHRCVQPCHNGDCPPCVQPTAVPCRCGSRSATLTCADSRKPEGTTVPTCKLGEAKKKDDFDIFAGSGKKKKGGGGGVKTPATVTLPFVCESRCTAKRTCGKHACSTVCCPERGNVHLCSVKCGKPLPCGQHRCEQSCHTGRCPDCLRGGFDELACRCGATVIMPPIPCGTAPPTCRFPCVVPRECGHATGHNCHTDTKCPPCVAMEQKLCASHKAPCPWLSPCYMKDVVCKNKCLKQLCSNEKHRCQRQCHAGPCSECKSKCHKRLPGCGHNCTANCHEGACPPCTTTTVVFCRCSIATQKVACKDGHAGARAPCGEACRQVSVKLNEPSHLDPEGDY